MRTLLVLLALIPSSSFAWNLMDVSILMPLPSQKQIALDLITAETNGGQGPFLPQSLFSRVGGISNASTDTEHTYENLRAISYRFDPCPTGGLDPKHTCEPELRIVWQPMVWDAVDSKWTTEDAALHTFYRLSPKQYQHIKSGLLSLKSKMQMMGVSTENKPLGVHAAFESKRTALYFQSEFQRLMKNNLGEQNLYRITAMKLLVPNNWWKFFTGFEKDASGKWKLASIPRHPGDQIDIINDAVNVNPKSGQVDEMDASIFALMNYPTNDDLRPIVSSTNRRTMLSSEPKSEDLAQFTRGVGAIHRFQNPKRTSPRTVDCAHCHFANPAATFTQKAFPGLNSLFAQHPDKFVNPEPKHFVLTNTSIEPSSTKIVRAFGYFESSPAIMTRTIHDSAEAAHYLNLHP